MLKINTFVFFDIETTGLPQYEHSPTKITELAFIACSREHLLATKKNEVPRVLHKILLPIQPMKCILPDSTKITGLDNFLLEHVRKFDADTVVLINSFLNRLIKPVCLVAHNGNNFDYPLLNEHVKKIKCSLPEHLFCIDSINIFKKCYETLIPDSVMDELLGTDLTDIQKTNETTPSKAASKFQSISKSSTDKPKSTRCLFSDMKKASTAVNNSPKIIDPKSSENQRLSYKLTDIFERLHNYSPEIAHNAEADTMYLLKCAIAMNKQFVQLADDTAKKMSEFI